MMMNGRSSCSDAESAKNVIKQILQEVVLCGLARSDFYSAAAFNGGTALRIFHGLPRFSEDLDFSVDENSAEGFDFDQYEASINNELESLGIPATFQKEDKEGFVKRAYVKGNCRSIFETFGIDKSVTGSIPGNEQIKVKVEADTVCVPYAGFETRFLLKPYPAAVRLFDSGSLFAGKISAVLARHWKTRVKGRDLYDYLFYIANGYPLNMKHLEYRLKYGGYIEKDAALDEAELRKLLIEKFNNIDYDSAKLDVMPFISNVKEVDIWGPELFISVTDNYTFEKQV